MRSRAGPTLLSPEVIFRAGLVSDPEKFPGQPRAAEPCLRSTEARLPGEPSRRGSRGPPPAHAAAVRGGRTTKELPVPGGAEKARDAKRASFPPGRTSSQGTLARGAECAAHLAATSGARAESSAPVADTEAESSAQGANETGERAEIRRKPANGRAQANSPVIWAQRPFEAHCRSLRGTVAKTSAPMRKAQAAESSGDGGNATGGSRPHEHCSPLRRQAGQNPIAHSGQRVTARRPQASQDV